MIISADEFDGVCAAVRLATGNAMSAWVKSGPRTSHPECLLSEQTSIHPATKGSLSPNLM